MLYLKVKYRNFLKNLKLTSYVTYIIDNDDGVEIYVIYLTLIK